jgi:DNA-binding MarR family transcriptional regulator
MGWEGENEELMELWFAAMSGDDLGGGESLDTDDDSAQTDAIGSLPLLVRRANLRFDTELRRVARDLGHPEVGPTGLHLLRLLRRRGQRVVALAEPLGITRQAVSQTVTVLHEHGLTAPQAHWAGVLIALTAEGRELLREVDRALVTVVWAWGMAADGSRLDALVHDLEVLAQDPRSGLG